MPIVRLVRGRESEPTPTMPTDPLQVLSLETAKEQLRITEDDADAIVTTAIRSAVSFVADAADVDLETIAESNTLRQAVIVLTREFFHGFDTIGPLHAVWSLINAARTC